MLFLVRFGEIHLKSRYVRRQFQERLVANIQDYFSVRGVECLTTFDRGRIYVHTDDGETSRSILSHVFGIVSFSPAIECKADLEVISRTLVNYARPHVRGKTSFAIRARRVGTHSFTSRDLAVVTGQAIQDNFPELKVNLKKPDVELHVEVRNNKAFLFHEIIDGPGGLPQGTQDRILALIDSERAMVATWMMMKRGCRVIAVTFDGEEFLGALRGWDLHLKVQRIASIEDIREISRLNRAKALVVGWDVAEVSERQGQVPEDVTLLHPIVGLDPTAIQGTAGRIRENL